ncbi:Hypothetical_protein [Hexamita inflata]|uniref:Hypothetical_protein n=1 Tax=Hexamita inflata TaxID=28002 RepID=A0AA86N6P7_9EUKA|nr:Hypothetical protein HINF_LOCUS1554 [Hexamita inflata]
MPSFLQYLSQVQLMSWHWNLLADETFMKQFPEAHVGTHLWFVSRYFPLAPQFDAKHLYVPKRVTESQYGNSGGQVSWHTFTETELKVSSVQPFGKEPQVDQQIDLFKSYTNYPSQFKAHSNPFTNSFGVQVAQIYIFSFPEIFLKLRQDGVPGISQYVGFGYTSNISQSFTQVFVLVFSVPAGHVEKHPLIEEWYCGSTYQKSVQVSV